MKRAISVLIVGASFVLAEACEFGPAEPVKPAEPAPTAAPAAKTVYFDVHELGAGKATATVAAEEHAKSMAAADTTVAFADYWVDEKNGRIIHVATGPSLAAVTAAHVAAHGATPGKVMELIEAHDLES